MDDDDADVDGVYMSTCMSTCMYVCMYDDDVSMIMVYDDVDVCMYVCMYDDAVCMYDEYMYVCMYVCMVWYSVYGVNDDRCSVYV